MHSQGQVVVAAAVTQEAHDQQALVPILERVKVLTFADERSGFLVPIHQPLVDRTFQFAKLHFLMVARK